MKHDAIFISYSRSDSEYVIRLIKDLREAGFVVWRDIEELIPGTANWEKAIRAAIKDASVVVLVASPSSLQSEYVQGELTVAKKHKLPIFPIWASGNTWIDCIPLDMANIQYVDGRKTNYEVAIIQLINSINEILNNAGGYAQFGLPTHEIISYDVNRFSNLDELLNKLYMFRLEQWFLPFTYGKDWVLGNVKTKQLALPWEWLNIPKTQPLSETFSNWGPLRDYDIEDDTFWGVWDFSKFNGVGIAVASTELEERLKSENSIYNLVMLFKESKLHSIRPSQVDPSIYPIKFFVGLTGLLGVVALGQIHNYFDGTPIDFSKEKIVLAEVV